MRSKASDSINSLVLGASRLSYYHSSSFLPDKVFNYSTSSVETQELVIQTEYAKKVLGKEFDSIFIGLDFVMYQRPSKKDLFGFLEEFEKSYPIYILKQYLNPKTLLFSIENLKRSITKKTSHRSYDRSQRVHVDKVPPELVDKNRSEEFPNYYKKVEFSPSYKDSLKELIARNPRTQFIVFTTPISSHHLKKIFKNKNLFELYKQWISDIVNAFNEVYVFTIPNTYSRDYKKKTIDGIHFYPQENHEIIKQITQEKINSKNQHVITKKNIELKLEEITHSLEREFNYSKP